MAKKVNRQKWEYRIEIDPEPEMLMMLGKLGYELIATEETITELIRTMRDLNRQVGGGLNIPKAYKYIFKRPINE